MTSGIKRRVTALEKAVTPAGQYVLYAPASCSTDEAIAAAGICPGPQDTVVVVQSFMSEFAPVLVSGPEGRAECR